MDTEGQDDVQNALWSAANFFQELRQARHEKGEAKYGHLTFLHNDVLRMLIEELADAANYIEYLAAKLLLLQKFVEEDPRLVEYREQGNVSIGIEAFKGTGFGWKGRE